MPPSAPLLEQPLLLGAGLHRDSLLLSLERLGQSVRGLLQGRHEKRAPSLICFSRESQGVRVLGRLPPDIYTRKTCRLCAYGTERLFGARRKYLRKIERGSVLP